MDKTFEYNKIGYRTDGETLNVLQSVYPSAIKSNDGSAFLAVLHLGLKAGRISKIDVD